MTTITKIQRDNLTKLADFLALEPVVFNMAVYQADADGLGVSFTARLPEITCGSAACAIGWGPSAGIAVDDYRDCSWPGYARRVFGADDNGPDGEWLFHYNWHGHDNTARGAAARIRYYLEHDLPPRDFSADTVRGFNVPGGYAAMVEKYAPRD